MKPLLLIIDDDREFIRDFTLLLEPDFTCVSATTSGEGIRLVSEKNPEVVLLDLMLDEGPNGLSVLTDIRTMDSDLPVIMITDYAAIDTAVEAMKLGAFDYISKTSNMKELRLIIQKSLQQRLKEFQRETLAQEVRKGYRTIVGAGIAIRRVRDHIALFAGNENTVLITGESGVGKELVARQIHSQSNRRDKPFVAVNCAAIPRELMESELFGHEKGSFTGASQRKIGKFEIAADGVIFFDEISELDVAAQVKLLRVLQEREFERVGGITTLKTKARVIASTNRNLEAMLQQGIFREDLYYRLNVLPIRVPSLRERKEDIPLLIEHFLTQCRIELKTNPKTMTPEAIADFQEYDWPGNIRELQNYVTRAFISALTVETIDATATANLFCGPRRASERTRRPPKTWKEMDAQRKRAAQEASRQVEKLFIEHLLNESSGNITKAAKSAGLNRSNFHKMMKKCGVDGKRHS